MPSAAERRLFAVTAALVIVFDLVTKAAAEAHLTRVTGVSVFGEWFQLRLVYNQGAAFGLHLGPFSRWFFLGFAVLAVFVLNALALRHAGRPVPADRLRPGHWRGDRQPARPRAQCTWRGRLHRHRPWLYRWPTFNIADIAVTCGRAGAGALLWREDVQRSETASAG
jgi:signal peptidase II